MGENLGGWSDKSRLSLRGQAIFPALDPESATAIAGRWFVGKIDSALAVLAGHPAHDEEQAICVGLSNRRNTAFVCAGVVFPDLLLGLIYARITWPLIAEEQAQPSSFQNCRWHFLFIAHDFASCFLLLARRIRIGDSDAAVPWIVP